MMYTPVMGLEIHAELLTKTKVFCRCKNEFGGEKNTRICPRCAGLPGALPVLNKEAVSLAVRAGLTLGCRINRYSAFDRKNYFYPDLPKAYQITQFEYPICEEGSVEVLGKTVRVNRIHIEEDAGKLIHGEKGTQIDFNRCGVPLIEIVTEPDFGTADEVVAFVDEVSRRLKFADVCDCRLEQGSLRVDVNISLKSEDSQMLGVRAEIKNLNSRKSIRRAIEYEIKRQTEILASGDEVARETRRFSEETGETSSLRGKEDANDYRYFHEPDLPGIEISKTEVEEIASGMPEMPQARYKRYIGLGISSADADLILADRDFSDLFDGAVRVFKSPKTIANLMLGELSRKLNESGKKAGEIEFSADDLAEIAKMSDSEKVSKQAAREILSVMFDNGGNLEEIANERGLFLSDDKDKVALVVAEVLAENRENVREYKNGVLKLFGYFMGEIMRRLGGSGNPKTVKEELTKQLTSIS